MNWSFLSSYLLVAAALIWLHHNRLGLEKSLFINSLRAFVQLLALGYVLTYLFAVTTFWLLMLIVLAMALFAAYTAKKRTKIKHGFQNAFLAIASASLLVLFSLTALGIITTEAREFITIGGMIVGNAMNIYALVVSRFKDDVKLRREEIEGYVALGAPLREALHSSILASVKQALIPVVNNLQTVGIVLIPGIMSGMILAGADPLEAVSYQLVIMYMILAISLLTSLFATLFNYRDILAVPTR